MTLAAGRTGPAAWSLPAFFAGRRYGWITLAAVVIATLATRAGRIGDPTLHMDEQFYLLVGDRMWSGALPYVDLWDRKPVGLFLIYAALRPFSPDGIVAYQLGAAACAGATALVLARIASRVASPAGAIAAAVAYLLWLPLLQGAGGQSPVFYDLLTALAVLCALKAGEARDDGGFHRFAAASMLLAGLALQVKTIAVFEGAALGLWLTVMAWRRMRDPGRTTLAALGWMALALVPTLLAAGAYAAMGRFDAFWSATVVSVFAQRHAIGGADPSDLAAVLVLTTPLIVAAAIGAVRLLRREAKPLATGLLCAWAAAGVAQVFVLGHVYPHYAIPAAMPLAILAGAAAARPALVAGLTGLAAVWSAGLGGWPSTAQRDADVAAVRTLTQTIAPYLRDGPLYVYDGPPILYVTTRARLATPYAFPGHLNEAAESAAVDAPAAMRALLARRPAVILAPDTPSRHPRNRVTEAMLQAALRADYRVEAALPDPGEPRRQIVYVRGDLPRR